MFASAHPRFARLSRCELLGLVGTLACASCEDVVPLGNWGLVADATDAAASGVVSVPVDEVDETEGPVVSTDVGSGPSLTDEGAIPEAGMPSPPEQDEGDVEDAGDSEDAGGTEDAGDSSIAGSFPSCRADANSGPFNAPGLLLGATETSTDWLLPAPTEALEWELMIEDEIEPRTANEAPTSGYYWSQQFYFVQGLAGRLGIQAEGLYQPDPIARPTDVSFTKMAAFWLSGPPLAAQLGDIPYPDARTATQVAAGATWGTIHARFEWQTCHVYSLRFGPESTDENGNIWYGAWIEDTTDGSSTFLGRMLLPADTGLLSPFVRTYTSPIDFGEPQSCEISQYSSAIFGAPKSASGISAKLSSNNFLAPRCATSRFSLFDGAVRHELGVVR